MYDHIDFHTDEDFPTGLSQSHAAIHMGFYWAWAVSQNLHNPGCEEETPEDVAALKTGHISGAEFVLKNMGGELEENDFSAQGQRFTAFYYDDEDEGYGAFMEDYVTALNTPALASFYHVENSPENQAKLNVIFQAAFTQWQASLQIT